MESNGNKYVGEWKRTRFSGQGIYYHKDGNVQEGVWENNEFQYAKKTPYSRALISSSTLGVEFQKITKKQRVQIQLRLKDLGLYPKCSQYFDLSRDIRACKFKQIP